MTKNEVEYVKQEARPDEWRREVAVKLGRVKEVLDKVNKYATA